MAAPQARWIALALGACLAIASLAWLATRGGAGRGRQADGDRAAGPAGGRPLRPGDVPPEVRDAIAGRPVTPRPLPGEAEGLGIRPAAPAHGPAGGSPAASSTDAAAGAAGPGADGALPAGGAPPLDDADGSDPLPSASERDRRAAWHARQVERDALRIDVLAAELGLDAVRRDAVARALAAALAERVALYESIDPEAVDRRALSAGLDGVRGRLAEALGAALGPEGYVAYQRMEREGRFALPSEQRAPR